VQQLQPNPFLDERKTNHESVIKIREILLLNKTSGLPILSRIYERSSSGKDPVLVAGLLAAIIRFGETIGSNIELNDIGIQDGGRIFLRSSHSLVCVIIIENFKIDWIAKPIFLNVINDIASRIFEVIKMLFASSYLEPLSPLEELLDISYDDKVKEILKGVDENKMSKHPEIGFIIDNIVLESTMMLEDSDELIEETLMSMEMTDTTYLSKDYTGKYKDREKIKKIVEKLSSYLGEEE